MKLPLAIAEKLLLLLTDNSSMPASSISHLTTKKMLEDGVLQKQQISNTKAIVFIPVKESLAAYLHNHFGIISLETYIHELTQTDTSRATAVTIASNSKLTNIRTFKGFLVNSYQPVAASLNAVPLSIFPVAGSYTFISNYDAFSVDASVTIVGIENPENFLHIRQQAYLFEPIQPLFVSRYPQSNDLVKWLQQIPNPYLHFGDLDFAGINIYQHEYKKYLGNRASFFLPNNTEDLLRQFGNKELYNRQYRSNWQPSADAEENILRLHALLSKYKKVLEQEIFIKPLKK